MAKIETIVFDLDGTLYQDRTYVTTFLQALLKNTKHAPYLPLITQEAQMVLEGNHRLKPGQFVDITQYEWKGYEPLLYQSGIDVQDYALFDERYRYIGDGWQVCFLIASILGCTQTQIQACFLAIRKWMCEPHYQLSYNQSLPTILELCKEKGLKTVLMTNTVEEGADYFLAKMKLLDHFDHVIYDAGKPFQTLQHFQDLNISPATTLAIGDVPYNDCYPTYLHGGKTVIMSELNLRDEAFYDRHVSTFDELNNLLVQLLERDGEWI